ncbi:hypothetical protein ACFE04_024304 [Oxalis oulophora]
MTISIEQHSFLFGILGNVVSFMVFLAPVLTFYRIIKSKSTQGFQSIPYSVALFSSMLTLYYALIKSGDSLMLQTINSFGCFIESIYLIIYLSYATREAKIYTAKLLVIFNFLAYGAIVLVTSIYFKDDIRVKIVGWICSVFSVCVFAAPLSIMAEVMKTKSVEYLPFPLSLALTVCAVMWGLYGLSIRDFYVATPNVLGLILGIAQMVLYFIYRKKKPNNILLETKPQENISKEGLPEMEQHEIEIIRITTKLNHPQEVNIINNSDSNGRVLGNSTVFPNDELV